MKVLIAEDDPISRVLLSRLLVKAGYEVVATLTGQKHGKSSAKKARRALPCWTG